MDLKKRTEYHKKKQKGLSPFGIGIFNNPVGSMETFNNSTCMGEELNESNSQEDFNTVKLLLKIASEGSDNEKVKAVSDVVEALPEDAVVELFDDLTEVFNDITLTDKNKNDIANSAGINYEGQGPDLLSKFLDFIDIHQQCKDNPKLVKSVVMVILSIVMVLEPTPVVEIILAIISTLPANWISTLVSVLSWLQPGTWLPALANYSYDKLKGKNMVDIKENLNQRDIRTGNAYDLVNLYSSLRLDDNQRNNLIEMLACNSTNESVYNFLASGCRTTLNEDADNYESDGWDDDGVVQGASFFCDGYDWKWIRRIGDVEHLDFDNWAVWMAFRPEDENRPEGRNIVNFFVVDEDTGFIDWGPVETEKEAREFLQSKVNDWEEDLDEKLFKETDLNKKVELQKQINELEDEIGDAIDDDDMYAQTALVKKQKILQEGPKEKSNAKIICDELNNYLKENGCNVDVGIYDENTLMAGIEWGDWKHDHQNFRNLVLDFFWGINEEIRLKHKITDTDGSDTYSADYKIYLQNEPIWLDANDVDNDIEVDEDLSEDDLGHILYNDKSDRIHIVTKDETLNEERNTVEYNNTKYRINIDGDEIQISSSHPYDDAEYCWAKSKDNGYTFIIYRDGKQIEFFESESEDFSDILAEMDRLDKDIKPIMVHN